MPVVRVHLIDINDNPISTLIDEDVYQLIIQERIKLFEHHGYIEVYKPTSYRGAQDYWQCNTHNKYHTQIRVNNKNIHLGYFDTEYAAAESYADAAMEYFNIDERRFR